MTPTADTIWGWYAGAAIDFHHYVHGRSSIADCQTPRCREFMRRKGARDAGLREA